MKTMSKIDEIKARQQARRATRSELLEAHKTELSEDEAQLVIGAIPLQALPDAANVELIGRLAGTLTAALNAMRSYQYGNSSSDLAREIEGHAASVLEDVRKAGIE